MSNQMHSDATLGNGVPPQFPEGIVELQTLYNTQHHNGNSLEMLAQSVAGFKFVKIIQAMTSDQYIWFWGCVFRHGLGTITILFPWGTDYEKFDGTNSDRHIAIHAVRCSKVTILKFIQAYIAAMTPTADQGDNEASDDNPPNEKPQSGIHFA